MRLYDMIVIWITLLFRVHYMKKLVLSAAVIFGFLIYSAYERNNSPISNASANSVPYVSPKDNPSLPSSASASSQAVSSGKYRDGTYTGTVVDAFYGNVQVQATIQGGKISNVQFLQSPNDRGRSILISSMATPILASEAVQAQSAIVDTVSGATDTSNAFVQSLSSALTQAQQ